MYEEVLCVHVCMMKFLITTSNNIITVIITDHRNMGAFH